MYNLQISYLCSVLFLQQVTAYDLVVTISSAADTATSASASASSTTADAGSFTNGILAAAKIAQTQVPQAVAAPAIVCSSPSVAPPAQAQVTPASSSAGLPAEILPPSSSSVAFDVLSALAASAQAQDHTIHPSAAGQAVAIQTKAIVKTLPVAARPLQSGPVAAPVLDTQPSSSHSSQSIASNAIPVLYISSSGHGVPTATIASSALAHMGSASIAHSAASATGKVTMTACGKNAQGAPTGTYLPSSMCNTIHAACSTILGDSTTHLPMWGTWSYRFGQQFTTLSVVTVDGQATMTQVLDAAATTAVGCVCKYGPYGGVAQPCRTA